jgi:acyl-CoA thioesterase-1
MLLALVALASMPARAQPVTILGFGDSLMAGYGLPDGDAFPTRLEAALRDAGYDVTVINAGVSGDTTAGGAARLAWSLSQVPDAAIVELGGNDGLRGIPTPETRRNLEAILAALADQDIPVLFTGMLAPPNMGREYGADFAAVFTDLAAEHDVIFYPFFLDGVASDLALNQPDGIHPNREGVDAIVGRILPYAKKLVERAQED